MKACFPLSVWNVSVSAGSDFLIHVRYAVLFNAVLFNAALTILHYHCFCIVTPDDLKLVTYFLKKILLHPISVLFVSY